MQATRLSSKRLPRLSQKDPPRPESDSERGGLTCGGCGRVPPLTEARVLARNAAR